MGVDRHGHFNVAVAEEVADDLGWDVEVKQERHAGVAEVVESHLARSAALRITPGLYPDF
jgi:hypothetical protein